MLSIQRHSFLLNNHAIHSVISLLIALGVILASELAVAEVKVLMKTSEGDMELTLDDKKAPITVANFVQYAESGFYNNTIFHRVIRGFMIQGGGFDESMKQKKNRKAIINEGNNGLKNDYATIAMARTNNPNSATSQFFINHKNNDFLNTHGKKAGYAVFGKVSKGVDVLEKIAQLPTSPKGRHQNVPNKAVVIKSVSVLKTKPIEVKAKDKPEAKTKSESKEVKK